MAIAAGNISEATHVTGVTSRTLSHNNDGNCVIAFIYVTNQTTDNITGVTYNGTALTDLGSVTNTSTGRLHAFVLIGAASGTNDLVVSLSGSSNIHMFAYSLSGVGSVDNNATYATPQQVNLSTSITTNVDEAWVVMNQTQTGGTTTAGANTSIIQLATGNWQRIVEPSTNPVPSAGSVTMNLTNATSAYHTGVKVSLAPASPSGGNPIFFSGGLGVA